MARVISTPRLSTDRIDSVIRAARRGRAHRLLEDVRSCGEHTNEVLDLRLKDGRRLVLKAGRHDWSRAMFETSTWASALLREAGVLAPEPLPLPAREDEPPLQAYWRISLPTLASQWGALSDAGRERAVRTLAQLMRRVHRVRLPGWGELRDARQRPRRLFRQLERDLVERLLPAVQGEWMVGREPVLALAYLAEPLFAEYGSGPGTLAHNDLHMDNVLCREDEAGVTCVGLLDLDAAAAYPPESDVARLQVLHGPHFTREVESRWTDLLAEAYPVPLDPRRLSFFRGMHLANLGFHSAVVGDHEHAALVAEALHAEVERLRASTARPQ